jgi:hypothetical protein
LATAIVDRLWSDSLSACAKGDVVMQCEVMRRTQHLMILISDRAAWPR